MKILALEPSPRRQAAGLGALSCRGFCNESGLAGYGKRRAVGHPAGTRFLAAATDFVLPGRRVHRLHLRKRGAEGKKDKPDEAFHI
jgi:hypothetical protein